MWLQCARKRNSCELELIRNVVLLKRPEYSQIKHICQTINPIERSLIHEICTVFPIILNAAPF